MFIQSLWRRRQGSKIEASYKKKEGQVNVSNVILVIHPFILSQSQEEVEY